MPARLSMVTYCPRVRRSAARSCSSSFSARRRPAASSSSCRSCSGSAAGCCDSCPVRSGQVRSEGTVLSHGTQCEDWTAWREESVVHWN